MKTIMMEGVRLIGCSLEVGGDVYNIWAEEDHSWYWRKLPDGEIQGGLDKRDHAIATIVNTVEGRKNS